MNKKKEKRRFIILCLAPAVILFTVFMVYPTINVFLMSTLKWGGFSDEKTFVGLNNFLILFKDMNFIRAFQNTIFVIVIVTIFTLALAIIFASILVREKLKGQNFFRVIFYIPNILSIVVIGAIFSAIYDPSANGLLNSFLGLFMGKDWQGIPYLGNQSIVMYSIAFALIKICCPDIHVEYPTPDSYLFDGYSSDEVQCVYELSFSDFEKSLKEIYKSYELGG